MSKDNVIFISGSSRGIGAATARRFAKAGYQVGLTYNTGKTEVEDVADECRKLGAPETFIVHLDLSSDESIREATAQIVDKFHEIIILVNNAGVYVDGYVQEQTLDNIHRQIAVNLEGQIKLTHEMLPVTTEAVINIASRLGLVGKKKASVYSATKWGLRGFTKSLALENPRLRVLAVLPGLTATQMGHGKGIHPDRVAEIIFLAATGHYGLVSGSDVVVRYYLQNPVMRTVLRLKDFFKRG